MMETAVIRFERDDNGETKMKCCESESEGESVGSISLIVDI